MRTLVKLKMGKMVDNGDGKGEQFEWFDDVYDLVFFFDETAIVPLDDGKAAKV
jgi:hypothetical protein